ncbi:MAG: hypothetical protein MUC95_06500 [Spirochaetes bacterium]|nr:hypothetical protein [Spirochaetota bacterium]
MKKKGLGLSAKFLTAVAAVYAVLIITLSFSFHYILKINSDILKDVLVTNNEYLLLKKSGMIIQRLGKDEIKDLQKLTDNIREYCKDDDDFLWILIFNKTYDENYFKVKRKLALNPLMKLNIRKNWMVKEEKATNYLQKALTGRIFDPKIYSSNGVYWQCFYHPFKIKNTTYVIEFLMSSLRVSTALNEYAEVINRTKKNIIYVTSIVTAVILIITLLFTHNFTRIIRNISEYMRKAAAGELSVSLRETTDSDLNELAISFNTIVSELKVLKEKENPVRDLENKDSLNDLFKFGVNILKENRFDDSINIFKTLTMLKPDGFGSYFNLGVAYAKKREYGNSIAMFNRALESNPGHEHTINYIEKVRKLQNVDEGNSS